MQVKFCKSNELQLFVYNPDYPIPRSFEIRLVKMMKHCFPSIWKRKKRWIIHDGFVMVLLAKETKKIVACMSLSKEAEKWIIWDVCTHVDFLRQGCSEELFHLVFQQLKQKKIHQVFLYVSETNEPAKNNYIKLGFEYISKKENHPEHWLMSKTL